MEWPPFNKMSPDFEIPSPVDNIKSPELICRLDPVEIFMAPLLNIDATVDKIAAPLWPCEPYPLDR
jgi:hypothetical protein